MTETKTMYIYTHDNVYTKLAHVRSIAIANERPTTLEEHTIRPSPEVISMKKANEQNTLG